MDSEPEHWPTFRKYIPQVISLQRHSLWPKPPVQLGLDVARMLCDVGTYLWHTGQNHECDEVLTTAENIINGQPKVIKESAESEDILGSIYNTTGILCDIVGVSKRHDSLRVRLACANLRGKAYSALEPSQRTMDENIRNQAPLCDIGCAYMQRSQYEAAAEIFEDMMLVELSKVVHRSRVPVRVRKVLSLHGICSCGTWEP